MPLSKKDREIASKMSKQYGSKKGKKVFYATLNKRISEGRPINVPESKRLAARRKHHRKHKRATRRQ